MTTRLLKVTLTVPVRDMTATEYEAEGGASADELGLEEGEDPKDVVGTTDASEFREAIEGALDSELNPELLAGSGLMVVIGAATVAAIDWLGTSA